MRKVLTGEWESAKVKSKGAEQESTGPFRGKLSNMVLSNMTDQRQQGEACFVEGGQAGKVQGNQVVRTLQCHAPNTDANCHGGRLEPRADKEAVGACVFRLQVRSE